MFRLMVCWWLVSTPPRRSSRPPSLLQLPLALVRHWHTAVFLSCHITHLSSALHCKMWLYTVTKKKKRFYETFSMRRCCKAHECVYVEIRDFSYIQLSTWRLGGVNMWLTDVSVWETRWNPRKGGMMSHSTSTTRWHTKKQQQCQVHHH